jgi:hypothetical protein
MSMIRVRFRNLWQGFNPHDNQILAVLSTAGFKAVSVVVDSREEVDLEIGSVYPTALQKLSGLARFGLQRASRSPQDVRENFISPGKSPTARRGIWLTPENQRPPAEGWDATLSFETDPWPSNAYLPFWQLNTDLFGCGHNGFLGRPLLVDELITPRETTTSQRPGFCCAVLRNPEPVRMRAIRELSRIGRVDVLGPVTGRPVPDKFSVFGRYRFVLCFENDLYPGYVTEKPFDAWAAGSVPLYRGLDARGDLNSSAVLNMATLGGFEGLLDEVQRLESDRDAIDDMTSRPLLRARPDVSPVLDLISTTLRG